MDISIPFNELLDFTLTKANADFEKNHSDIAVDHVIDFNSDEFNGTNFFDCFYIRRRVMLRVSSDNFNQSFNQSFNQPSNAQSLPSGEMQLSVQLSSDM